MFIIGIVITGIGFILALAVHPENPGAVDVNTIGWILVVVGLLAFIADLVLWSTRGRPGYLRRTTVMNDPGYGAGAYPAQGGYFGGRRRVIEEEEGGPPGPGY